MAGSSLWRAAGLGAAVVEQKIAGVTNQTISLIPPPCCVSSEAETYDSSADRASQEEQRESERDQSEQELLSRLDHTIQLVGLFCVHFLI